MNYFVFTVGLFTSIVSVLCVNITAINDEVYLGLFFVSLTCSLISMFIFVLLFFGGGEGALLFINVFNLWFVLNI